MSKRKDKQANEKPYDIGYGKPPRHAQFKKGQSGNPSGRPKGTRNLKDDLADELNELVRVREGGAEKTLSKQRAMLKALYAAGMSGRTSAMKLLLETAIKLFADEDDRREDAPLSRNELELLAILEAQVLGTSAPVERVGLQEAPDATAVISVAGIEAATGRTDTPTNSEKRDE